MLELIRNMTGDGRTVLMCTHLLLEAEGLADEIVVMQTGTALKAGRPADLMQEYWPTPQVKITSPIPEGLRAVEQHPHVVAATFEDDFVVADLASEDAVPGIVADLAKRKVPVSSVAPVSVSLEELYFAIRRDYGSTEGELAPPGGGSGRPARGDGSGRHLDAVA